MRSARFSTAARMSLVMAALALLLLWLNTCTNIDLRLADAMYDPARGAFPWQHAWLTEAFAHGILKDLLFAAGAFFVLTCAWDLFFPLRAWSGTLRMRMRTVALSAILVPLAISLMKRSSSLHCPWDIDRYGGAEPYIRLLDALPAHLSPGHCFPAGHASSALWLMSLAVFWLPHRPRLATVVGGAMLLFGFALGWLQQMRGAHFLSHTLWSAWIACAIVFVLLRARNALGAVSLPHKWGKWSARRA